MAKYINADELKKVFRDTEDAEYARWTLAGVIGEIDDIEAADVVEVVRCKDCKHWRQQTNYQGAPLSFGFCESDDMWQSLYGETYEVEHIDTDDDFYCGYAKRRTDE